MRDSTLSNSVARIRRARRVDQQEKCAPTAPDGLRRSWTETTFSPSEHPVRLHLERDPDPVQSEMFERGKREDQKTLVPIDPEDWDGPCTEASAWQQTTRKRCIGWWFKRSHGARHMEKVLESFTSHLTGTTRTSLVRGVPCTYLPAP